MKQECPGCGNEMKEGVLPGWWLCGSCLFFLDVQDYPPFYILQYRRKPDDPTIVVPKGLLLIIREDEL